MDTFNKLTVRLQQHVWCLLGLAALLIFWLVAFSLTGKGSDIASWVSILFAVVVIVYMLIQGHDMRNLVEEGHRLMAEKAGTMVDTAGEMAKKTDLMSELMVKLFKTPEVEHVQPGAVEPFETDKLRFNASNARDVTLLVLYAAAQASRLAKQLPLRNVLAHAADLGLEGEKDPKFLEEVINNLVHGARGTLLAIECFLEPDSLIYGDGTNMEIKNLPPGFEQHISKELTMRVTEIPVSSKYKHYIETNRQNIDACFEES